MNRGKEEVLYAHPSWGICLPISTSPHLLSWFLPECNWSGVTA